jgi:hypothetical protein
MKVVDVAWNGTTYICIQHFDQHVNPFYLYRVVGRHRTLLKKYADMKSVMYHIFCVI